MKKYLTSILVFTISAMLYSVEKPLSTSGWAGYADGATSISIKSQNPLVAEVNVVGMPEGYPRLALNIANEDWRTYQKLAFDVMLESSSAGILDGGKDFVLVLQDQSYMTENTMGISVVSQQTKVPHVSAGSNWQSVEVDIRNLSRKQVSSILLYLYSKPFNYDHSYKVSVRNARLIGSDAANTFFDGTDMGSQSMPVGSGTSFASVQTNDGLKLDITSTGAISTLGVGGTEAGNGIGQASGIMVRDAKTSLPPVMVGGTLSTITDGVRQQADISSLNLSVDASYKNLGDRILVSGKVSSTNTEERSVTVYVALPIAAKTAWELHKSLLHKTQPFVDVVSVANLEDVCIDYPIATLADKTNDCGLGLMIDQTKPIAYRLVVNPKHKLFYVAFDVALLNQNRFDGTSQKTADFQIEILRTDPKWGFRSGLDRLYTIQAANYQDKIGFGGGWELWTKSEFNYTNAQNIEGGYRFDWSGADNSKTLWEQNVKNNFLNLLYTEPEYMQFSMGDNTAPTVSQTAQRFNNLIAGDATEWNTFMKLGYSQWYCGTIHPKVTTLRPFLEKILASANVSVVHDKDGKPVWNLGNRDWIQDLKHGAMMPCNISPNIPNGRGSVMREIGMDALYQEYLTNGWTAPSGFALDEFMMSPDDYRRENFKYMETPVSFDPVTKQPMVVKGFSSVEWVKKLQKDYAALSRKLFLMTNCKGSMTFVAPYLDIFGIEDTYPLNPDYFRVVAGKKRAITNVSYTPPAKKHIEYNMLWCTYVGRNVTYDVLSPIVKMEDKLYTAGWEPITGAVATPSAIRIERYGSVSNDTVYIVVHNMSTSNQAVSINLDPTIIGKRTNAKLVYNGSETLNISTDSKISFSIGDRETKVVMLSKDKYAFEWNQNLDLKYGDSDIQLQAHSENAGLFISYISDNSNVAEVQGDKLKIKHAGIVNLTAIQAGTETVAESRISRTVPIKKKGIGVIPTSVHKIVGASDPALVYTYTENGLKAGDNFTGNLSRDAGESAGTYRIKQGTLALSSDYLINFEEGFFFIESDKSSLTVEDMILNNGINPTVKTGVRIDNVVIGGIPTQVMVSENSTFSLAQWQTYKSTLEHRLSTGKGMKTIYLKVKDSTGKESNVMSKSIYYMPEMHAATLKNLVVSPNPVSAFSKIALEGYEDDAKPRTVKVMSLNGFVLGQFVMKEKEQLYDFSSYPSGYLLVVVEGQNDRIVKSIIKK